LESAKPAMLGQETKLIDFQHLTAKGLRGQNAKEKFKKKPLTETVRFHNFSRQSSGLKK
jgi:hypothetical protein